MEPLRVGITNALRLLRAVPERRLARSPTVVVVDGRVACDLELLGVAPPRHPALAVLSPRRGARHLVSAWRAGRLRDAGFAPALADDLARRRIDLHSLLQLVDRGCPPELAARILEPIDGTGFP